MKRFQLPILIVSFLLSFVDMYSQKKNELCGFDYLIQKSNSLQKNSEKFPSISSSSDYDSTTIYKIPVVFIVYNKGEAEGVGSNIPSSTITNMLNGMNDAFRARNAFAAGRDTKIEFEPVKYNGNCGLLPFTNGIVRVNASGVPGFLTETFIPGNPSIIKAIRDLHTWDDFYSSSNFIKVEFIPSMDNYTGIVSMDGIWIDITKGLSAQVLTHEMGHMNALLHTFYNDYGGGICPNLDPNNPSGDGIDDTQPHKRGDICPALSPSSINSCTGNPFGEVLNNFMSYSDISCLNRFSKGQIKKMRNYLSFQETLIGSRYLTGISHKPYISTNPICGPGTSTTLTSTGCIGTTRWYSSLTSNTILSSSYSFTTPTINADLSYFASCETPNCLVSPRVEIPLKILGVSINTNLTVTGNERCGKGPLTLTANGCSGTYSWNIGDIASSGSQFNLGYTESSSNFTLHCTEPNKCISLPATKQIIINSFTVEEEAFTCSGYSFTLKAQGCNGTYLWFNSATSNVPFAENTTGNLYVDIEQAADSYFVECNSDFCGKSPRLQINTYLNVPPAPILIDGYGCLQASVLLEVSSKSCIGGAILWYDSNTSLTALAAGRTFLTPVLNSSRAYYAACKYSFGCGENTSPRNMVIANLQACVCESKAKYSDDEDIFNVTIGSLNNTSNCSQTGGVGSIKNQYSNYKHIQAPSLLLGNTYPFSVQIGTCGGSYTNSIKVFIDYNRDGDFDDINEVTFVSPNSVNGPNTVYGNITIPNNITEGICIMRVVVNENPASATSSCSSNSYLWGETEDYYIKIKANNCNVTPPTTSTIFACNSGAITLNASGCSGGNIEWWSNIVNGFLLGTGNSYTTPKIDKDKTYYAACHIGNCTSELVSSSVIFSSIKDIFSKTNQSTTPGQNITLVASGCNYETRWYNSPTSNTILQVGTSFNTGNLSNSTIYYVSCHDQNANCSTSRVKIIVNVEPPCPSGELSISTPNYLNGEIETRQANSITGYIKASNSIGGSSRISYEARSILLENGFVAIPNSNGVFKVQIGGCN